MADQSFEAEPWAIWTQFYQGTHEEVRHQRETVPAKARGFSDQNLPKKMALISTSATQDLVKAQTLFNLPIQTYPELLQLEKERFDVPKPSGLNTWSIPFVWEWDEWDDTWSWRKNLHYGLMWPGMILSQSDVSRMASTDL